MESARYTSVCLVVCMFVATVYSRPRYIVIPIDSAEEAGEGWSETPGTRVARQAWVDQAPDQDGRVERQAHGHGEHVDYGAHTGHHGAFGWYADFPVKTDH